MINGNNKQGEDMKWLKNITALLIITITATILTTQSLSAQNRTIAFFSPGTDDNSFWNNLVAVTQAACNDLQVNLEVYYSDDNPDKLASNLQTVTSRIDKPDAVLLPAMAGNGNRFLKITDQNGVATMVFNIGVNTDMTGQPRQNFKHWIGQITPNDVDAGYKLARKLIKAAGKAYPSQPIKIYALTGRKKDAPTIDRVSGLKQAVNEFPQAQLVQLDYSNWTAEEAIELSRAALNNNPDIKVFWSASDLMALSMSQMLQRSEHTINEDVFVGGIDWTLEAINAVANGDLTTTVGGHLIEGGWACVLLYDYWNGKDFANTGAGTMLKTPMDVIDQSNVEDYLDLFGEDKWGRINFTIYSKARNSWLKEYKFTLETMLVQLR